MALRDDGTVWTWGHNWDGQLGNNTLSHHNSPVQVLNINNVTAIAAGANHTVALRNDGTVWTWGGNESGQLGTGTTDNRSTSEQVQSLVDIIDIEAGGHNSAALSNDGTIWVWGANFHGQLGASDNLGDYSTVPVQALHHLSNIISLAFGNGYAVGLESYGIVWTWGLQWGYGEWNTEFPVTYNAPVQIQNLNAIAIGAGNHHTVVVGIDGIVWTWGFFINYEDDTVGSTSAAIIRTPTKVRGLDGVGYLNLGTTTTDEAVNGTETFLPQSSLLHRIISFEVTTIEILVMGSVALVIVSFAIWLFSCKKKGRNTLARIDSENT